MPLYDYQLQAKRELFSDWDFQNPKASAHRSQMLYLPTGGGKTIVFNDIANEVMRDFGAPVLIIAHRKELIAQAAKKSFKAYGIPPDVIQGSHPRRFSSKLKVGSIQTLHSRIKRKRNLGFHRPPLIVIWDEAHHIGADSWREVFEYFPDALHLMVTATPIRKHGFEDFTKKLVQVVSVKDLEDRFYRTNGGSGLVPDTIFDVKIAPDFDKIKKKRTSTGYDFDNKPLNEILNSHEACEEIARCWEDEGGNLQKTIAFCIPRTKGYPVAMGETLAEVMRSGGYEFHYVGFETPDSRREELLTAYENNEILGLTNTNLFTEGFDVPDIGATMLCRPTASLGLYLQMVGRGKRTAPDKFFHYLFDFGGNVKRHLAPNVDRKFHLKGEPKKHGCSVVRLEDGEITTLEELHDRSPVGPLKYELLGSGEEFRIRRFAQLFEDIRKRERGDKIFAARGALSLWYAETNFRPSIHEMRAISNIVIEREDKRDVWATSRFENITEAKSKIDAITTPQDTREAAQFVEARFTRRINGERTLLPGYIQLRDAVVKASR